MVNKYEKVQAELDELKARESKREEQNARRRQTAWDKNSKKEHDKFVKHYVKGSRELLELKKDKILSSSDIGKFSLLCMFLQKDTGLIIYPDTNKGMDISGMIKELNERKQHFYTSLQKLIDVGLVMPKDIGNNKMEYYINPKYAFNGESRLNSTYFNLSNCTNITINASTLQQYSNKNVTIK